MVPSNFFPDRMAEDQPQLSEDGGDHVKRRQGLPKLIEKRRVSPKYGVYELLSPIIDADQAKLWLMSHDHGKGATTITETIKGDFSDQEEQLRARFGAAAIADVTGLTEIVHLFLLSRSGAPARIIKDHFNVVAAFTITADSCTSPARSSSSSSARTTLSSSEASLNRTSRACTSHSAHT